MNLSSIVTVDTVVWNRNGDRHPINRQSSRPVTHADEGTVWFTFTKWLWLMHIQSLSLYLSSCRPNWLTFFVAMLAGFQMCVGNCCLVPPPISLAMKTSVIQTSRSMSNHLFFFFFFSFFQHKRTIFASESRVWGQIVSGSVKPQEADLWFDFFFGGGLINKTDLTIFTIKASS